MTSKAHRNANGWLIALNVLVSIMLIVTLAVPWFQWKWVTDSTPTFGCSITHRIGWFQETCSVAFFCDSDVTFGGCSNIVDDWRTDASSQRRNLYNFSFAFMILALILNILEMALFIVRGCICHDTRKSKVQGCFFPFLFSSLIFLLLFIPLIVFPSSLPEAFNEEKLDGDCYIPGAPNLYNWTTETRNINTPCDSFSGSIEWTNGMKFVWGGSGIWADLTAVILQSFILVIVVTTSDHWCFPPFTSSLVTTAPALVTNTVVVGSEILCTTFLLLASPVPYNAQPYPQSYQQSYPSPTAPSSDRFQPVENFLRSLGLEVYIEAFRANDFDWETLLYFPKLSHPEQEKLIPAIGARLKLRNAIEQYLNQTVQTPPPPSYDQTGSSPVPPYSAKQV